MAATAAPTKARCATHHAVPASAREVAAVVPQEERAWGMPKARACKPRLCANDHARFARSCVTNDTSARMTNQTSATNGRPYSVPRHDNDHEVLASAYGKNADMRRRAADESELRRGASSMFRVAIDQAVLLITIGLKSPHIAARRTASAAETRWAPKWQTEQDHERFAIG